MKKFLVIGNPIKHSLSPKLHNYWFKQNNIDAVYEKRQIEDEDNAIRTRSPEIELTYNWDPEEYGSGRNFGHLALSVKNIYETCQKLIDAGVTINRPPREGRMAFIKSPDNISIELLQQGDNLEVKEPWSSMKNIGSW